MQRKRSPKQDELMIVNPGAPGGEKALPLDQILRGEDGTIYLLDGWRDEEFRHDLAEFYLGEDGTLYRLENFGPFQESALGAVETADPYGCYFLGEDGTIYQVINP
jgi:hypothetical protein